MTLLTNLLFSLFLLFPSFFVSADTCKSLLSELKSDQVKEIASKPPLEQLVEWECSSNLCKYRD